MKRRSLFAAIVSASTVSASTISAFTVLASSAVIVQQAEAQQLDLPRASPLAKTVQNVGLTEITVDYSSPGVKGRKIWGEVVPFGKVWRTGANKATKITFGKDVTVGTTDVPAGSYAFFAIPTAEAWTLILNKDFNQGGAFNYKQELDVVRIEAKPVAIPMRERLAYTVTDFDDTSAQISLEWEKLRVSLPVKIDTEAQVKKNLAALEENAWVPFHQAARYEFDHKNYDAGLNFVDRSLAQRELWINVWTKAQLLNGKGKTKEALAAAQKTLQLGEKDKDFAADGEADVKKAIAEWKSKR